MIIMIKSYNFRFLSLLLLFVCALTPLRGFQKPGQGNFSLLGAEDGLYYADASGKLRPLWKDSEVRKIVSAPAGVYLLTGGGVIYSSDMKTFKPLNSGLHFKTIKHYRDGKISFTREIQDLKDLEIDPANPSNMITCSRDGVFYSLNAGKSWVFLANPTAASGIKSVAIYSDPEIHILLGHAFKGIYHKNLSKNTGWSEWNSGLFKLTQCSEEVSDIVPVLEKRKIKLFAANNFTPVLYERDFIKNKWRIIHREQTPFGLMESLSVGVNEIRYVSSNNIRAWDRINGELKNVAREIPGFTHGSGILKSRLMCFAEFRDGKPEWNMSELWLLSGPSYSQTAENAMNKKGLYVQAGFLKNRKKRESLLGLMKKTGLNSLVIDMKDDWGKLRFLPESPLLRRMGITGNPIRLENLSHEMKKNNVYLIARLVLFQDRVLYHYNKYELAVKNKSDGRPWQGRKRKKNGDIKLIQEYWVNPYSEKVWEYNVEIAKELIRRGFDEIQFDYVRFTTDGDNLGDTAYAYRDKGMDRESAIMSFLSYARENIPAPISIDIYGANGWWRTSARTGQDVELFRKYVDVICPMFYPSHFAPGFMYMKPYDQRTYRIYFYGSLRNYFFGRKNLVIRPYIQAFKMNYIKYDREYYGTDYVLNQVKGVEESINMGYTFWNMGVKYQILSNVFILN